MTPSGRFTSRRYCRDQLCGPRASPSLRLGPTWRALGPEALAESGGTWDPFTQFPGPLKVNRPPSLRDNAAVATFLASDDSAYMSGITIPSCDGANFARTSIPIPENWSLDDQITF